MASSKVTTTETDVSKSVQNPTTGIVGYCGVFQKGDVFKRIRITNERELVNTFGKPDSNTYKHFYAVQNYLNHATSIDVVRAVNDDSGSGIIQALNSGMVIEDATGTPSATSAYIEDYENYTETFTGDEEAKIYAKNPGDWGNDIKIAIANYTDFDTAEIVSGVTFASQFVNSPEDTDEFAIAVIDNSEGLNTIVEKYIVSLTSTSKDANGNNNYAENVINGNSDYILIFLKSTISDIESISITALAGGVDGDTPDDGDIQKGYELFEDKENVDINYLISGGNESDVIRKLLNTIASSRKDCMAFIGPKEADIVGVSSNSTIVSNLVTDVQTLAINSSYTSYFGNFVQVYDAYNDVFRWVSVTGEISGLKVEINTNNETWTSMAGYNRGILNNPQKLAFSPNQTQRDTLAKNRINPIYQDTSAGFVLTDQETMLSSSSTFNQINVRELFIYIEKAISIFAREYLQEFNDATTRSLFKLAVEQFLEDVQGRRGLTDKKVICDESNNTATVIQNKELRADIAVKPNIVAKFITLNFFNVGPAIDFNEIV